MSALPARVLLVNPNRLKPAIAPIALDYIASALRKHHYTVDLLDLCFEEDWEGAVDEYFDKDGTGDPLAVGVTLRNTDDAHYAGRQFFLPWYRGVVQRLQSWTPAPIVLGGAGFSVMPEAIMKYCGVQFGVWGEGEETVPMLLDCLRDGKKPSGVPGLVYRSGGGYRRNPPRYFALGEADAPERTSIDNGRYFQEGGQAGVETKRGCPMGCSYCADPLGKGDRSRCRSPRSVADEVEQLIGLGIDHIHFCDSEFNLPSWHAIDVCEEFIRRGLGTKIHWYAYCAPSPFNREMANLFARSGCAGINFGADSGSDAMLKNLGRNHKVHHIDQTIDECKREGLPCMIDLLLGGPGETRETLRQSIEVMKAFDPDRVGASLGVRVYPGTALARFVRTQGPLMSNPNLKGGPVVDGEFFEPVYYVSAEMGEDPVGYLDQLIGNDERFFRGSKEVAGVSYNYADNRLLVEAIGRGYKGAYWDILRRLSQPPG